jgi:hypothetical protein
MGSNCVFINWDKLIAAPPNVTSFVAVMPNYVGFFSFLLVARQNMFMMGQELHQFATGREIGSR